MIDRDDIAAAERRIRPHIRRTPCLDAEPGAFGLATAVNLKLEFLQHAGSFKPRGAFNTLLSSNVPSVGVAAASGGNHGIAVAHAARDLGHAARIFVPVISTPAKVAAIRARGADLVVGGDRYVDALDACDDYIAGSGALSVHAYDAWATMAGQGTVGLEWEEQAPTLDTVLVAVGGGGLVAGIAAWFQHRVKVVGVEPEGSTALASSLAAGRPVDVSVDSIAADSLGARNCGPRVLEVATRWVDQVVLVTDVAIKDAQRRLWSEMRVAAEPGGAAALAALVSGAYRPREDERVGVLLCGANVALDTIAA
jgi:threonine dehydratase